MRVRGPRILWMFAWPFGGASVAASGVFRADPKEPRGPPKVHADVDYVSILLAPSPQGWQRNLTIPRSGSVRTHDFGSRFVQDIQKQWIWTWSGPRGLNAFHIHCLLGSCGATASKVVDRYMKSCFASIPTVSVAWTTEPSFGAGVSFTISSRAGIADADFLVLPPSASNSLSVFSCIVCVLQSCLHRRGFRRGAVRARESFRCWKLTAGVIRIAIRKVIFGGRLTSSSTA
ncbi:unnamed protein product [Prorocentrum cordatum]|uniref:Uncharacterized protein n=1 Tax=Prorocentrum cordatum TaxID=2364126 RepID=A0ABN9XY33_9DINO|nr:unnamed protein product [Polarella glacialis]